MRVIRINESQSICKYPPSPKTILAEIEYIDPHNNYGYGQGAIGWYPIEYLKE